MRASRFVFKRYQLKKEALQALQNGHPWIFRKWISSAASVFHHGQWLRLFDGQNNVVGYGIYEEKGAVAIRILQAGAQAPDLEEFRRRLRAALDKRRHLRLETDGFRALNGESDGFPGVVIDIFGSVGVLQTYSAGSDALGRWAAAQLKHWLSLDSVIWKTPLKRLDHNTNEERGARLLWGQFPRAVAFREGDMRLCADLAEGQKSGLFLDLRGLRRWVRAQNLKGKKVLNMFCYSGTLGLACEKAGAREIWQLDISGPALEMAGRCHILDCSKHRLIEADGFSWLKELPDGQNFDLIIVDTPSLTSKSEQLPQVLRSLQSLYKAASRHVRGDGLLALCDCTSRIQRQEYERLCARVLGHAFRRLTSLPPEADHAPSPGFKEGDYLKVLVFQKIC